MSSFSEIKIELKKPQGFDDSDLNRQSIESELLKIESWLPHQGPLGIFIHQNTLSAFEHRPFYEAVEAAALVRGARPYMPHDWYLRAYYGGRINLEDCVAVLNDFQSSIPNIYIGSLTNKQIQMASLFVPRLVTSDEAVETSVKLNLDNSGGVLELNDFLWLLTKCALEKLTLKEDSLFEKKGITSEGLSIVDEILVQFASSFLDDGVAYWPLPAKERGFYKSVRKLMLSGLGPNSQGFQSRSRGVRSLLLLNREPLGLISAIISAWGLPTEERFNFLRGEALKLCGWAGRFAALGHSKGTSKTPTDLTEYMAIRLLLCFAFENNKRKSPTSSPSYSLWVAKELALVLNYLKVQLDELKDWTSGEWQKLYAVLSNFGDIERRRLLHLAYERHFSQEILGAIQSANPGRTVTKKFGIRSQPPQVQAVFCIDEREESLRRLLEEIAPDFETFGAAGFFGLDMFFQNACALKPLALCPPVITPKHLVVEQKNLRSRSNLSKTLYEGSRRVAFGAFAAQATGVLGALPLAYRVLLPGFDQNHLEKPEDAILEYEFTGKFSENGMQVGFKISEMVDRVEGILRGMGLTSVFSPFIVVIGHGSQSANNPHESAHDCGACGGSRGAPNARVFARMANHPQVRTELLKRGIGIPENTWFIGGYHDTCSDSIHFFDLDVLPADCQNQFNEHKFLFNRARALNASERCRRFSIGNTRSPEQSLQHVGFRSADLREPRPEYGHATNAALIVGRRDLSRGLFLDRRSFLLSYDPTSDHGKNQEGMILSRLLGAVIPVCSGISLEYYFSFVDNDIYGCGTKLPHNVVGLLGVMDGPASDLRTGLPLQMVEIHEPMRLVVLVESNLEIMTKILEQQPTLARLVNGEWIQMYVREYNSGVIYHRRKLLWNKMEIGSCTLPRVASSLSVTKGVPQPLSPVFVTGEL